jgi:hypothetical protein
MVMLGAASGCGHHPDPAHPADPFAAIAVAPLPVNSLNGSSVLLLVVGGLSLGDSTGTLPDLETRRAELLQAANATLDTAVRLNGRGVTWMGLEEQRRAARRNPTLGLEPDQFATSYLLGGTVDRVPDPLWGQLRSLGAITGARFAVVPAAVRIAGQPGALTASYVVVVADVRTGTVMFRSRAAGRPMASPEAALASAAGTVIATPLH